MIGQRVLHYRIIERLGGGGMGVVFKAEDTKLKRTVALKFLSPHAIGSHEEKARFVNEARAAAALDHPNICTVYEINEDEENIFISMAFAQGKTLKERIRSGSPLPIDEVLLIAIQVGKGLAAAHDIGIVHRDIKSSNVIVAEDGQAKILDFGLAEISDPSKASTSGEIVGTAAYMSPEQTRGEAIDHRTDIWSLGVCVYEMITGSLPFGGDYAQAIIYAILNEEPPAMSSMRPDVPFELEQITRTAMAKNPDERYQNLNDMLSALRMLRRDLEIGAVALSPTANSQPSIAVLPFANLSGDKAQDYFCEGITEDITNHLAKVEGLRVASRTSAFAFKGKHGDVREIGKRLGVDTLLEGSVQKSGSKLRITAQLVSVADGYHAWSEKYDRELKDVFAIQDEIARSIVKALKGRLTEQEERALEKASTVDVQAYDYYLRGRQYFYRSKRSSINHAREMFLRAIEKDPEYALAYAGMADCHSYLYMYFDHSEENLKEAVLASKKALELDPELAEAHAARGFAFSLSKRYEEAEQAFQTSIRLNPGLFEAYYFFARTCFVQGKLEEAAKLFERASEVDPDGFLAPILLGQTYRDLNRPDKAEATYRKGLKNIEKHLELNPDNSRAIYLGAAAYIALGEKEQGLAWARKSYEMDSEDPYVIYGVACAYARVNHADDAIKYLELAVDAGFAHKAWIENDSDFDSIRSHPRYEALLKRLS